MYFDQVSYTPPDPAAAARLSEGSGKPLFISIETTGLSHRNAYVFMFTAVYPAGGGYTKMTMLADSRRDERRLLTSLNTLVSQADTLHSFGHFAFSGRFLRERWDNLNDGASDFFPTDLEIVDIQHRMKKISYLLPFSGLGRAAIEESIGFKRTQTLSGREIAESFARYEKDRDEAIRQSLIQHQTEDIDALFMMQSLLAYDAFARGRFHITGPPATDEALTHLTICAEADEPFPFTVHASDERREIVLEGHTITITVPLFYGKLKFFLPGPVGDYYYLPEEDRAVHKSVAVFVDKAHRKKATRATCYIPAEGYFLVCEGHGFDPVFSAGLHEKPVYIQYDRKQWADDPGLCLRYAQMIIQPQFMR